MSFLDFASVETLFEIAGINAVFHEEELCGRCLNTGSACSKCKGPVEDCTRPGAHGGIFHGPCAVCHEE